MLTGTTGHVGALVTALAVLTGAAILRGGAAAADPNQDDQFLALLDQKGIPALSGVPSLIDTAHKVCRKLDAGMSADGLVDLLVRDAYGIDPPERDYAPGRLARTEARFITASVEAYCPWNQSKTTALVVDPTPGSDVSMHRSVPDVHHALNVGSDLRTAAPALDVTNVPSTWQQPTRGSLTAPGLALASLNVAPPTGDLTEQDPPPIPAPPPPAAHIRAPNPPMAAPPRPEQPLPPQQPPPPAPQQPPAVGPQPGGANGSGGDGGNGGGGGGPAEQSPPLDRSPGFVRLAP